MFEIHELQSDECRFALTDSRAPNRHPIAGGLASYPHRFCGERVQPGSKYCPAHHARCYSGKTAKPWQELAGMMAATEQTVRRVKPQRRTDRYAPIGAIGADVAIKGNLAARRAIHR